MSRPAAPEAEATSPAARGAVGAPRRVPFFAGLFGVLALMGPGIIAANAGNDAGGIATYAAVGAAYGYSLLWVMVLLTFAMAVVQEMCARMGAATGEGFTDLVRGHLGIRWTLLVVASLLIANGGTVVSEFAGIAAAAELFGIPRYVAVPPAAALVWFLVVRGSYRRVERVFLAMTLCFFAYPVAAYLAAPDWGAVLRNAVVPTVHWDYPFIYLLVATMGTTITPYMQLYVQSAVAEKGVTMAEYGAIRLDVYAAALFSNLISAFIIIATAAALFGTGVAIESAGDAARALAPLAGPYASTLFGVGLLGASLLAAAVLPLSTAYSVAEALGFEKGVSRGFDEAPVFLGLYTALIVVGALVALVPGVPLIELLIIVQVINGLLLPIVLISILRLVNRRDIMGDAVNGPVRNLIAWTTTIVVGGFAIAVVVAQLLPGG